MACDSDDNVEQATELNMPEVNQVTLERSERALEVFETIPSPMETAAIFHNNSTTFNTEILNASNNQSSYITNGEKALNLGVYAADLSYVNIFDQPQQSIIYINCIKKMTEALVVSSAFSINTIQRIEDNINNRDSLMIIINDAFWIIDTHLKKNGQDHLSALVMSGGWIEGLYLGTKTLDRENLDSMLMQKIANQKPSLMSLMDLLITYDNSDVVALEKKMKPLQVAFAKIDEKTIDPAIIFEISDAVEKIRTGIIMQ